MVVIVLGSVMLTFHGLSNCLDLVCQGASGSYCTFWSEEPLFEWEMVFQSHDQDARGAYFARLVIVSRPFQ